MNKKIPKPFSQQGPGASILSNLIRFLRFDDPHENLGSILELTDSLVEPLAPIADRTLWVAHLVSWLRGRLIHEQDATRGEDALTNARSSVARVRFFLMVLGRHPQWSKNVSTILRSLLIETDATSLLTRTALDEHSGFFTDLSRRVIDKIIPPPPRPGQLSYVVDLVFTNDRDPEWLANLTQEDWDALVALVDIESGDQVLIHQFDKSLREAVLHLSIQVAARGLHPETRERAVHGETNESAFLNLTRAAFHDFDPHDHQELLKCIELCQAAVRSVHKSIEEQGVSLALLYRQETLSSLLRRLIEICLVLNTGSTPEARRQDVRELMVGILRAHRGRTSVSELLSMNFDLFAKKLVEHAGETGEHYITRNVDEYKHMFWSGGGGGFITVFTTLLKLAILALHAPLLIEGLLVSVNYSGSFLTMQFCGYTLATKQPSMTAAALAGRIQRYMSPDERAEFVEEVVRITRSQVIAAIGNVSFVVVGCIIVALAYQGATGRQFLDSEHSVHIMKELNPFTSFTIFYAALTGVLLWLSSLCAGWLQNWVNMRSLRTAIQQQRRLQSFFGARRTQIFGEWFEKNAAAIGGNVSIGVFMAFVPMMGKFSGLPIDIRHITLSSGSVTLAAMSLGREALNWRLLLPTIFGLLVIVTLNFSISFLCALMVATRSRRMPISWLRGILGDVGRRFRRRPLDFLLPNQAENELFPAPAHGKLELKSTHLRHGGPDSPKSLHDS